MTNSPPGIRYIKLQRLRAIKANNYKLHDGTKHAWTPLEIDMEILRKEENALRNMTTKPRPVPGSQRLYPSEPVPSMQVPDPYRTQEPSDFILDEFGGIVGLREKPQEH